MNLVLFDRLDLAALPRISRYMKAVDSYGVYCLCIRRPDRFERRARAQSKRIRSRREGIDTLLMFNTHGSYKINLTLNLGHVELFEVNHTVLSK